MALDKSSKSMLNPYASGENYGYNGHGPEPTNYAEVVGACQRTSGIEKALSNVTKIGDQEDFPLGNNGAGLGKVYQSKAGE